VRSEISIEVGSASFDAVQSATGAGMDDRTEEQPALALRPALLAAETRDLGARPDSKNIRDRLLQVAMQLDRSSTGSLNPKPSTSAQNGRAPPKLSQLKLEAGHREGDRTMKRSRFTEEQIIGVLREREAGASFADLPDVPIALTA